MANEIEFPIRATGLTGLYCRPRSGGTFGDAIALAEVAGAGGLYANATTPTLAQGLYTLYAFDNTDAVIGAVGPVLWDGSDFVPSLDISAAQAAAVAALGEYTAPTLAQMQAAGFTTDRNNALELIDLRMQEIYQRQGLDEGVTATVVDPTVTTPGSLTVREGSTVLISQTLTKPDEDTVTISRNA